jgi:probable HAF family extracellular repeat protein
MTSTKALERMPIGAALVFIALASPVQGSGFSFQSVGFLSPAGGFSTAAAISADGKVVVGGSNGQAYRWTRAGGMISLGDLPGVSVSEMATGVSADGSVIVGVGTSSAAGPYAEAFRWTSAGIVGLGDLPGGAMFSKASGVSGDGSIVVGFGTTSSSPNVAFRWTDAGMVALPLGSSIAWAISEDGATIVGGSLNGSSSQAFAGNTGLGDFPGGSFYSTALGVSADGTFVVGWGSTASNRSEAFRWTASSGLMPLGNLNLNRPSSMAFGVSADGRIVVGSSAATGGPEAFIWTETDGMQNLRNYLMTNGVTGLVGWTLKEARAISRDGRTIVGNGSFQGRDQGWIVTIPEPSTYVMAAMGIVAVLIARRRNR